MFLNPQVTDAKGFDLIKAKLQKLLPALIVFCLVVLGGLNLVVLADRYTVTDVPHLYRPQPNEFNTAPSNSTSDFFDFTVKTSFGVDYSSNDPDKYYYVQYTVNIEPKPGVDFNECYFTVILDDWFKENSSTKFANYFGTEENNPVSLKYDSFAPKGVFLTNKIYFNKYKNNEIIQQKAEASNTYIYCVFKDDSQLYKYMQNKNLVFTHPVN